MPKTLKPAVLLTDGEESGCIGAREAVDTFGDKLKECIGFIELDRKGYKDAVYYNTEPDDWRQIKGDPAIRSGLFLQQRVNSIMDSRLDEVLPIMNELMCEHGVFHGKLHFSSSRGTIWTVDDPFIYRILSIEELTDPDICLAYPGHPYPERAIVPAGRIMDVFNMFRTLRFADETVYLRAGSLNIINGMVGLNFSCDGSHYMRYDEFLEKNAEFWFGSGSQ
jgi:hypothetical protein